MSISDLFKPNYYDLYCDTLQTRQLFVSGARSMGYFYSASDIMVPPPTVGSAPIIEARATGSGGTVNAFSVLHILPGTTCDLYINLTQPAEDMTSSGGAQRGYYTGNVAPTYVISTAAATSITSNVYKSTIVNTTPEDNMSTLFFGPSSLNTGVSTNIQSSFQDIPNIYVDTMDVYTLKISIVSGPANIYFYGAFINYAYFFY